jgi:SPP1 gp7 family putative phage head morphogenesis protein
MPVTASTLRQVRTQRAALTGIVDGAAASTAAAWDRAWRVAAIEWETAADVIAGLRDDGTWPTRTEIDRERRARRALAVTRALLDDVIGSAVTTATTAARRAVDEALAGRPQLITSQVPPTAPEVGARVVDVTHAQVVAVVDRTTTRITALHRPLSAVGVAAVHDQVIRGVLTGDGPRSAAARMVTQARAGFDLPMTRALVIARTEILDAHRTAAAVWDRSNGHVVAGWQWLAALDRRTCPSCWAMHGTTHPPEDPGPQDHQQGRCTRVPLARPWSALGITAPEPPSAMPDARTVFAGLPEADQVHVMGRARLDLLGSGEVGWADLTTLRTTTGWRDSHVPTPLHRLRGDDAA